MSEALNTLRTPGIVIFVAILNFITSSFALMAAVFCAAGLVFGNVLGLADIAAQQISKFRPDTSVSYGVNLLFLFFLFLSVLFMAFFLTIGVGLVKGRRFTWYLQIAMSILGLAAFPIGTAMNAIIIFLFFRAEVRDFFGV